MVAGLPLAAGARGGGAAAFTRICIAGSGCAFLPVALANVFSKLAIIRAVRTAAAASGTATLHT